MPLGNYTINGQYNSEKIINGILFDKIIYKILNWMPNEVTWEKVGLDESNPFDLKASRKISNASELKSYAVFNYINGPENDISNAVVGSPLNVIYTHKITTSDNKMTPYEFAFYKNHIYYRNPNSTSNKWLDCDNIDRFGNERITISREPIRPTNPSGNMIWLSPNGKLYIYINGKWYDPTITDMMDRTIYDKNNRGENPFEYFHDKMQDVLNEYNKFLKHKNNLFKLIHLLETERAYYETLVSQKDIQNALDTSYFNNYLDKIQEYIQYKLDLYYNNELYGNSICSWVEVPQYVLGDNHTYNDINDIYYSENILGIKIGNVLSLYNTSNDSYATYKTISSDDAFVDYVIDNNYLYYATLSNSRTNQYSLTLYIEEPTNESATKFVKISARDWNFDSPIKTFKISYLDGYIFEYGTLENSKYFLHVNTICDSDIDTFIISPNNSTAKYFISDMRRNLSPDAESSENYQIYLGNIDEDNIKSVNILIFTTLDEILLLNNETLISKNYSVGLSSGDTYILSIEYPYVSTTVDTDIKRMWEVVNDIKIDNKYLNQVEVYAHNTKNSSLNLYWRNLKLNDLGIKSVQKVCAGKYKYLALITDLEDQTKLIISDMIYYDI